MKLRRLTKADILKASGIVKANYSEFYGKKSKAEMADAFGKGAIRPRYLVAEEKGKIIGLTGYMQSWIDYNAYEIFWVNVSPKHQGKGIGTMLVKGAIAEIKKKRCQVRDAHCSQALILQKIQLQDGVEVRQKGQPDGAEARVIACCTVHERITGTKD